MAAAKPMESSEKVPSAKGMKIEGKVSFADGTPASGAVVTAIHLESGRAFRTEPAGSSGRFEAAGVPYGYYLFAIEAKGVLHASSPPFNVPPGRAQEVLLVLRDSQGDETPVPGFERAATASADAREPAKPFFKKPAGVATIVAASLLALLLKP